MSWSRVNTGMMRYCPPGQSVYYVLKVITGTAGYQETTYWAMQLLDTGLWNLGKAESFSEAQRVIEEHADMVVA